MPTYTVQTGTLPAPFCEDTWQEVLAGFNAASTVVLPDNPGTIIQQNDPDPTQRTLLWVKTDGSGNPVGSFIWSAPAGKWVQVPGIPYYFTDGSTDTSLTTDLISIDTHTNVPNHAAIIGRLFLVEIGRNNPGPVTFQVDGLEAKPLRKGFDQELVANELKAGHLALVAYEDVPQDAFQLLTTLAGPTVPFETDPTAPNIPGRPGSLPIAHGFGVVPKIVNVWVKCITSHTASGYIAGDLINLSAFFAASSGVDQQGPRPMFTWSVDATNITIARREKLGTSDNVTIDILDHKTGGDFVTMAPADFNSFAIKVYARI